MELDTGSIFSDYDDYIQSFNATTAQITHNLADSLYKSQSRSQSATENRYSKGDAIMALKNQRSVKFPLP